MRKLSLFIFTLFSISICLSCTGRSGPDVTPVWSPQEKISAVLDKYSEIREQYSIPENNDLTLSTWPYSYHPVFLAAWSVIGSIKTDEIDEALVAEGGETYSAILSELYSQAGQPGNEIDYETILALIDDPALRDATRNVMDGEPGVLPHYAFCRAFADSKIGQDQGISLVKHLANLYVSDPSLLDSGTTPEENPLVNGRDWLQMLIAASSGLESIFEWNDIFREIEKNFPDTDFWQGTITMPYSLRIIQAAKGRAYDSLPLHSDRDGYFKWAVWDLVYTLHSSGGMFQYTPEQVDSINTYIHDELFSGGDYDIVADAIGRAPHIDEAERLLDVLETPEIDCVHQSGIFMGLAGIFSVPFETWENSISKVSSLKSRTLTAIQHPILDCDKKYQLTFVSNAIGVFGYDMQGIENAPVFTSDELILVHDKLFELFESCVTIEEKFRALEIINYEINRPEFIAWHPELTPYIHRVMDFYNMWAGTTGFENTDISEEEFNLLLKAIELSHSGSYWENE